MQQIESVVVVGGGSAGWLTAGLLAAEFKDSGRKLDVTLIESPDVPTIGVGEGTWPTMRTTLRKLGIDERLFLRECCASFKQGTQFVAWCDGGENDAYYHPFSAPAGYPNINLISHWAAAQQGRSFADCAGAQVAVCEAGLAPKQPSTPDYAAVVNYGYHLDAGKFSELLQRHCTLNLHVTHLQDHVNAVESKENGDIRAVVTASNGALPGDLFIDCSGMAAILLKQHFEVDWVDCQSMLFNDSALAVQLDYPEEERTILSTTVSTAQSAGWVWDIGLSSRRGIGYTYSSAHIDDNAAEVELRNYLHRVNPHAEPDVQPRKLAFRPGYRERFWVGNCLAVGLSAGFVEPLEASALVMVELSARMLCEEFPADRASMTVAARRFNEVFDYRWRRIVDFLKLHYILSSRESDYWADNRRDESIPDSLKDLMMLWAHRPPEPYDLRQIDEIFSPASYQYVFAGMRPDRQFPLDLRKQSLAQKHFAEVEQQRERLRRHLPKNRELLGVLAAPRAAVAQPESMEVV